jgi:hypothetical protein
MVRLSKSRLPSGIEIKSERDYRSGEVFNTLISDCHGKCYLCEEKPTTINVEHIVPHRSDPELKYDWDNLYIACGHCNGIKGDKFSGIIDPVKVDPEEHIALTLDFTDNLVERVKIDVLTQDDETLRTAELLSFIYNGGGTDIKDLESSNLRDHILRELNLFSRHIDGYKSEPELHEAKLAEELSRASEFAAFKRKMARDDPVLSANFAIALE